MTLKQGIWRLVKIAALLAGLFALFVVSNRATQVLIEGSLTALITGPHRFLERTLPEIRWNTGAVGFSLLVLLLLVWVSHHFLKWISTSILSPENSGSKPFSWRCKWTLMLVSGLCLWFATTLSLVAFQNQTRWLIQSDEKWVHLRRGTIRLFTAAKIISTAINGVESDTNKTAAAVVAILNAMTTQSSGWAGDKEDYEYAFVYEDGDVLKRVLVTYRDPAKRKQAGFVEIDAKDGVIISYPIERFQDFLNPKYTDK